MEWTMDNKTYCLLFLCGNFVFSPGRLLLRLLWCSAVEEGSD